MIEQRAYTELFGEDDSYRLQLRYSAKFRGYNANIRMKGKNILFSLSRQWEDVDDEIQVGLLQSLLCRLFRKKYDTVNMRLYNGFLKNVHLSIPKNASEPELSESFARINERFFDNGIDECNLRWGRESARLFGSYDYGTDTITLNPLLRDRPHLLDYVMFHEMLHKKYKFRNSFNRTYHHTPEFRKEEERYPDRKQLEQELARIKRGKNKCMKLFPWF